MLCQFTFKNYKSYKKETTIEMQAENIDEFKEYGEISGSNIDRFAPYAFYHNGESARTAGYGIREDYQSN